MNKMSFGKISNICLTVCLLWAFANQKAASQTIPPSHDLGGIIFVQDPSADRDDDGLRDNMEYALADYFKPYLLFDSEEKARRSDEPKVLFQVRPLGCIGVGCEKPWRVWIAYSFLFLIDGGYGRSSTICEGYGGHTGDNDRLRIELISNDGRNWTVNKIVNSHGQKRDQQNFTWNAATPNAPKVTWFSDHHVKIYMSGSKHHQYFDTTYDSLDSPYSMNDLANKIFDPCDEDVNGAGDKILPTLLSPLPDKRPSNVGEKDNNNSEYFITGLPPYGFAGRAWGREFYNSGTDMRTLWMNHGFVRGKQFCKYSPQYNPDMRRRITVTFLKVEPTEGSELRPNDSFAFHFDLNGQKEFRYPATGTTENYAFDLTTKNSLTLELTCESLSVRLGVSDRNGEIGYVIQSFDGTDGYGAGGIQTANITRRLEGASMEDSLGKLFTVTYRINVYNIPGTKRSSVK